MSHSQTNHLSSLLETWHAQKDDLDWVLATIIETDGSSYRKPGAIMFINSLGQYFGLLSGGCLEADIMRQARKCLASGKNQIIQYDMRDEDDLAWKLGIGCGGMVSILLQPLSTQNNYLELLQLRESLLNNKVCFYLQEVHQSEPQNQCLFAKDAGWTINRLNQSGSNTTFISEQKPVIRLGIFGGGIDSKPLVAMAKTLGWHVTVFDERLGYAKESFFSQADAIVREKYDELTEHPSLQQLSAIVLMNHNIVLDAKSLQLAQVSSASYIGMLGPDHRTERVYNELKTSELKINELQIPESDIGKPLFNPVGLALGGELPESIALSILSEIHAVLHNSAAKSLSNWADN
jgi:xanthine/CO dehydrogenase XdhC/CoxF family maturation factor